MLPVVPEAIYYAIVAGAAVALVGPFALSMIGFTTAGIRAGSIAASLMSPVYTIGYGFSLLSTLQSKGALGSVGGGVIDVIVATAGCVVLAIGLSS